MLLTKVTCQETCVPSIYRLLPLLLVGSNNNNLHSLPLNSIEDIVFSEHQAFELPRQKLCSGPFVRYASWPDGRPID